MSNKGWVKFHREQFGHWVSKNKEPFCDGYAWCYLYTNANHKKGIVNFRNEYIEVERGQLLRSKLQLQENFKWTRRHVENFLLALENDEMITYRMTNRYTVITILNYEKYQGKEDNDDIQNTSQVTNRKQTEDKQIANDPLQTRIYKNVKNVKNDKKKNIYAEFVKLTDIEYQKLIEQFGEVKTTAMIKNLSDYIGSKGDKYKSHYHTLLMWENKNKPKSNTDWRLD